MDPDDVAAAARRLSAKMVADQAVDLMVSFVGLVGDPAAPTPTEDTTLVLVARGREDRKSTRLNSSHIQKSRMPSSA